MIASVRVKNKDMSGETLDATGELDSSTEADELETTYSPYLANGT